MEPASAPARPGAAASRRPRFQIEPLEERVAPCSYNLDLGFVNIAIHGAAENVHISLKDVYLITPDGVVVIDKFKEHLKEVCVTGTEEALIQNVHIQLKDVYLIVTDNVIQVTLGGTA